MLSFRLQGIDDSDEADSIKRCLRNLYTTPAGSIPCDREFGLSWACVDMVPREFESVYGLELIQKTDKYESRVRVTGVEFVCRLDGTVEVSVEVKAKGGIGFG